MICNICKNEFEPRHFNQKYCGEECKHKAKRISQEKYKKSEKGIISNNKWINSERRKDNEKRYRQNPIAKHKAVLRTIKYLKEKPEAIEKKRQRDIEFGKTEKGRQINRRSVKKYSQTEKGRLARIKAKYTRRTAGEVDKVYINKLLKGNKCFYCGEIIIGKKTIDHKTPISKGGTNENNNLVLCCVHCNTQKGNKNEFEYRSWLNEQNKSNL